MVKYNKKKASRRDTGKTKIVEVIVEKTRGRPRATTPGPKRKDHSMSSHKSHKATAKERRSHSASKASKGMSGTHLGGSILLKNPGTKTLGDNGFISVVPNYAYPITVPTDHTGKMDFPIDIASDQGVHAFLATWEKFHVEVSFAVEIGIGRGCSGQFVLAYLSSIDIDTEFTWEQLATREYSVSSFAGPMHGKKLSLTIKNNILLGGDVFFEPKALSPPLNLGVLRLMWRGVFTPFGILPMGANLFLTTRSNKLHGYEKKLPELVSTMRSGLKKLTQPDGTIETFLGAHSALFHNGSPAGIFPATSQANPTGDPSGYPANLLVVTTPEPGHTHATLQCKIIFRGPVGGFLANNLATFHYDAVGGQFNGVKVSGSNRASVYQCDISGVANVAGLYHCVDCNIHWAISWLSVHLGKLYEWITSGLGALASAATSIVSAAAAYQVVRGAAIAMSLKRADGTNYPLPDLDSIIDNTYVTSIMQFHHKATTGVDNIQYEEGAASIYPLLPPVVLTGTKDEDGNDLWGGSITVNPTYAPPVYSFPTATPGPPPPPVLGEWKSVKNIQSLSWDQAPVAAPPKSPISIASLSYINGGPSLSEGYVLRFSVLPGSYTMVWEFGIQPPPPALFVPHYFRDANIQIQFVGEGGLDYPLSFDVESAMQVVRGGFEVSGMIIDPDFRNILIYDGGVDFFGLFCGASGIFPNPTIPAQNWTAVKLPTSVVWFYSGAASGLSYGTFKFSMTCRDMGPIFVEPLRKPPLLTKPPVPPKSCVVTLKEQFDKLQIPVNPSMFQYQQLPNGHWLVEATTTLGSFTAIGQTKSSASEKLSSDLLSSYRAHSHALEPASVRPHSGPQAPPVSTALIARTTDPTSVVPTAEVDRRTRPGDEAVERAIAYLEETLREGAHDQVVIELLQDAAAMCERLSPAPATTLTERVRQLFHL